MTALTIDHLVVPVPARPARDAAVIPFPAARAAAPARGRSRLHITRRGRLTLTVVVVLAVTLVAATALAPAPSSPGAPARTVATTEVVVTPGATLWDIAASVATPGADVRDVIADIRELNGLESSGLVAGQELVVPVAA